MIFQWTGMAAGRDFDVICHPHRITAVPAVILRLITVTTVRLPYRVPGESGAHGTDTAAVLRDRIPCYTVTVPSPARNAIHGHSVHNRINFGGSSAEFQTNYGDPWGMFADAVIPRPLITEDSVIPPNAFGVSVFPGIDLNVVTPADIRVLIAEYWAHILGVRIPSVVATLRHSSPISSCVGSGHGLPSHPLGGSRAQPIHYDTVKFSLRLPLALLQTLNTLHTTIWAEHLVRTSSPFADTPFVLYFKERLMGVNGPLVMPVQATGDSIATATLFNCATAIVMEGSSQSVGSSNSQEGPWETSSLVRTSGFGLADNVLSYRRRGYVCSDEEANASDDDA
ncbi:hypothetical protein B0H14DRAFT_2599008 [Mycena olivaceomarginata]|nr:hypothetical protein B0H14DRAFT_2599008 [Mycena olivaceomarginata]